MNHERVAAISAPLWTRAGAAILLLKRGSRIVSATGVWDLGVTVNGVSGGRHEDAEVGVIGAALVGEDASLALLRLEATFAPVFVFFVALPPAETFPLISGSSSSLVLRLRPLFSFTSTASALAAGSLTFRLLFAGVCAPLVDADGASTPFASPNAMSTSSVLTLIVLNSVDVGNDSGDDTAGLGAAVVVLTVLAEATLLLELPWALWRLRDLSARELGPALASGCGCRFSVIVGGATAGGAFRLRLVRLATGIVTAGAASLVTLCPGVGVSKPLKPALITEVILRDAAFLADRPGREDVVLITGGFEVDVADWDDRSGLDGRESKTAGVALAEDAIARGGARCLRRDAEAAGRGADTDGPAAGALGFPFDR